MRVSTNTSLDCGAITVHRRGFFSHVCVICGENVSCRTVNCWVRLPCGLRHAIPLQNDLQKGNTPDSSFCALAALVRLARPLPGRTRSAAHVRSVVNAAGL